MNGEQFALKPMNCPHHAQIFASRPRTYRDMPVRYMEATTDYRDEKTGELGGLSRVRCLTQDDSHVFCRNEQIKGEVERLVGIVRELYSLVGMSKLRARLSYRNDEDKYLGDKELWKHSMRVAAGCEYLANLTKVMDADEAFIAGFVHDVGKMVLQMTNEKLYTKVLNSVEMGTDVLDAERKYFDSDHVRTGSLLAKRWQLPILLANIISYHHAPSLSSIPVPCNLVCFIDKLVQDNYDLNSIDKDFVKTLGIDFEDLGDLRDVILQKSELLISELS